MGRTPSSAPDPRSGCSDPGEWPARAPAAVRGDRPTLVLAVDTTTEFGSLALASAERVVDEMLLHSREGFGQSLYGHLEAFLRRNGVELDGIACFAALAGPGSFTGVRVGLAAVKGLAASLGKPAVALSNLQVLASFGSGPLRAPVLDARRGEIYGAVYDDSLRLVEPEVVAPFQKWLDTLPHGVQFVSTDFNPFRVALAGTRFATADLVDAPRALAGAAAVIAARKFAAGVAEDPAALDANYVRRSDAELFWTDPVA